MKRREFITLLGGAAAAWPLAARAQQAGADAAHWRTDFPRRRRLRNFRRGLVRSCRRWELGWIIGRNVRIDIRWAGGDAEASAARNGTGCARTGRNLGHGNAAVGALLQATRTSRSYSRSLAIPSAPDSSTAWRARAATPPVFTFETT